MVCSGAVTFSLMNGAYVGTTLDGTAVVVSRIDGAWYLTSLGIQYLADQVLDAPLSLAFRQVVIGCGTVDITLSADMGPCVASSSVSSSWQSSSSGSSVSASSASATVIVTGCCPGGIPSVVFGTFTNATGTCGCLNGVSVMLTFNGVEWLGTVNLCGAGPVTIALQCVGSPGLWNVIFRDDQIGACGVGAGNQTTFTCSPLLITFPGLPVTVCCAGTVDFVVSA